MKTLITYILEQKNSSKYIKFKKIIDDITKLLKVTNGYNENDIYTFIDGVIELYDHYEGQYDDFDDVIDNIYDEFYYDPREFEKYKDDHNNKFYDELKRIIEDIIMKYDKNVRNNFNL